MMTMRNIFQTSMFNISAMLVILLLTGCQQLTQTKPVSATQKEQKEQKEHSAKYIKENENLKKCHAQLQALKVINQTEYATMQRSFDNLMNSAAQYTGVRKSVDENTQDTVDSLYHYRANQLCARIAQNLLDSLTTKGEARP